MDSQIRGSKSSTEQLIAAVRSGMSWADYPGIKKTEHKGRMGAQPSCRWSLPLSDNLILHICAEVYGEMPPEDESDWEYEIHIQGHDFVKNSALSQRVRSREWLFTVPTPGVIKHTEIHQEVNQFIFEYAGRDAYECCFVGGHKPTRPE